MINYGGQCSCGTVKIEVELPKSIESFSSRACNCDFCRKRNIHYLSHKDGALSIHSELPLDVKQQGSEQAEFLMCSRCEECIAASVIVNNHRIGAANATLLKDFERLENPEVVSPKLLAAEDKLARWQTLWMAITIHV